MQIVGFPMYWVNYVTVYLFSGTVEAMVRPAESYICQYCDREFKQSDDLVRHEMQHLIGNSYEVK